MRRFAVGAGALILAVAGVSAGPASAEPGARKPAQACEYVKLPLPEDAPVPSASQVWGADDTGRHVVGRVRHSDGYARPVLWTDGKPAWLIPDKERASSIADSVTNDGRVVGMTQQDDGTWTHWIYQAGEYVPLPEPAGLIDVRLTAINNRGDIVGYGWDSVVGDWAPIVKPAGEQWRRLPVKEGGGDVVDISDSGVVIGRRTERGVPKAGVVWKSWTDLPLQLPAKERDHAEVLEIRGQWIAGYEITNTIWDFTGLRWTADGVGVVSYDQGAYSVNTSGDVATQSTNAEPGSKVVRADGSEITFPVETDLRYVFNRGGQYVAAGVLGSGANTVAVLWTGCS
ncbi:hypothetical protein [Kribbella sp. NPDC023855]|uniref:hypothetical protein n=1 Tax=Kribbella sp. NPDC023855 TaxID=3154698 RepID=UPI0033E4F644